VTTVQDVETAVRKNQGARQFGDALAQIGRGNDTGFEFGAGVSSHDQSDFWIARISKHSMPAEGSFGITVLLQLQVPHLCIAAFLGQQGRMGAALGDAAMLQHHDFVGIHDRR